MLLVQEYGYYWGLPRGHIKPGESAKAAATREIAEETGITQLQYIADLGSYQRYTFDKAGAENGRELKHLTFFLFTTQQTELNPQDANITDIKWLQPDKVADLLINPKDKAFYEHAKAFVATIKS